MDKYPGQSSGISHELPPRSEKPDGPEARVMGDGCAIDEHRWRAVVDGAEGRGDLVHKGIILVGPLSVPVD